MNENVHNSITSEIEQAISTNKKTDLVKFALSALGGAIPLAGGILSGVSGAWSGKEQEKINSLFNAWMKIQEDQLEQIGLTLSEVLTKVDLTNEEVEERIKSKGYSELVRKCFRDWSAGDSEEKRKLLSNLLTNAASCSLTSDDVIKMFIDWIEKYNKIHFKIISIIYINKSATRYQVWNEIYNGKVREDSAEADLFKLIIQDLSMGHVIRQYRPTDSQGNFLKKQSKPRSSVTSNRLKTAFDDEQEYVLTELGMQFVHYTMNEITTKINAPSNE